MKPLRQDVILNGRIRAVGWLVLSTQETRFDSKNSDPDPMAHICPFTLCTRARFRWFQLLHLIILKIHLLLAFTTHVFK